MRGFADQLSAVGQIITDEDLQMYILAGFGLEYEALVVNFMQRTDSLSLQEMQLAFQAYELRIAQQVKNFSLTDPSANAAFYGGARGAVGRGFSGNRGGNSKSPSLMSIVCQLCGKISHVALKCFHRFDVHFTGPNTSDSPSPQAFAADVGYQEGGGDASTWYMDSGATNHITNELANLSMSVDYQGSESIMVGNGNLLPISSIGCSSIPLDQSANSPYLLLNNFLFVPAIAKNLLSISQFTLDNNVIIEFHHDCCFVKNKTSQRVLLKGKLVNGLYQLDLSKLSVQATVIGSSLKSSSSDVPSSFFHVTTCPTPVVTNFNVSCNNHCFSTVGVPTSDHVVHSESPALTASPINDMNTLHKILGHPNHTALSRVCEILHVPFSVKHVNLEKCIIFLMFPNLLHLPNLLI